jgi:hypothetical protein
MNATAPWAARNRPRVIRTRNWELQNGGVGVFRRWV